VLKPLRASFGLVMALDYSKYPRIQHNAPVDVGKYPRYFRAMTVSHIWAIDEELARHLRRWPNFRKVIDSDDEAYANHCPHCGAPQDDMYLHSEPDEPFFDILGAAPGSISLTPLSGTIRLSGDEHFQVD
jgi:hypothetical protein